MITSAGKEVLYGIGVDESNHGVNPEIYVATLTTNLDLLSRSSLGKTHKKPKNLEHFLQYLDDFRFVVLREKHFDNFGSNSIKAPAIGLLINSFSCQINISQTQIVIDGSPVPGLHNDLVSIISRGYNNSIMKKQIRFAVNGDMRYPLVNYADAIAYRLKLIYEQLSENEKGPYDDKRIPFEDAISIR